MATETGIRAVKEKIQALREDKAQVQEVGKREILRQKIRRLKRRTRRMSRDAKLQPQNAAAAPAEAAAVVAPAAPEAAAFRTQPRQQRPFRTQHRRHRQ